MKWAIAISILFAVSVMMAFSEEEEERRLKLPRWLNCNATDCPADKPQRCLKCCMFKQKFQMWNATTAEDFDKVIDKTCQCMHDAIKKQH